MAGPWDSPKFVTQKSLPKVLPDIRWSIVRDQGGFIFCDQRPVYRMATKKLTARSGRATDFQLARPLRCPGRIIYKSLFFGIGCAQQLKQCPDFARLVLQGCATGHLRHMINTE